MRYYGQQHVIPVVVDDNTTDPQAVLKLFHEAHRAMFGFSMEDRPAEFVTYKLSVRANVSVPDLPDLEKEGRSHALASKGVRMVNENGKVVEARIYERGRLPIDEAIKGPAVIEEPSTVTLVGSMDEFRIDEFGFIRITFCG